MKKTLNVTDVVTTTCPFELHHKLKSGFPKPEEIEFDFEFLKKLNPESELDQGIAIHKLVEARLKGLTHLIDVTPEWNEVNKVSARYASKIKGFAKKAELHSEELDFMTFSDGYAEIELAFKPDVWWLDKDDLYLIDMKRPGSWADNYLLQLRSYTALLMQTHNIKTGHFLCLNENKKSVWQTFDYGEAQKIFKNIEDLCLAAISLSVDHPVAGCENCLNICDNVESWAILNRKHSHPLTRFWASTILKRSSDSALKLLRDELIEGYPLLGGTKTVFNPRDPKLISDATVKYEELSKKPSLTSITKEECIELGLNPENYLKEVKTPMTPPFKWGL